MPKALQTFIDPLTGECVMAGSEYVNNNKKHIEYLTAGGLLLREVIKIDKEKQ